MAVIEFQDGPKSAQFEKEDPYIINSDKYLCLLYTTFNFEPPANDDKGIRSVAFKTESVVSQRTNNRSRADAERKKVIGLFCSLYKYKKEGSSSLAFTKIYLISASKSGNRCRNITKVLLPE